MLTRFITDVAENSFQLLRKYLLPIQKIIFAYLKYSLVLPRRRSKLSQEIYND